jgi:hypothetical protein
MGSGDLEWATLERTGRNFTKSSDHAMHACHHERRTIINSLDRIVFPTIEEIENYTVASTSQVRLRAYQIWTRHEAVTRQCCAQ